MKAMEYKLVSIGVNQGDEAALNELAVDGWRVHTARLYVCPAYGPEMICLLERSVRRVQS